MLAAVQAFTLKHLIFGEKTKDTASKVLTNIYCIYAKRVFLKNGHVEIRSFSISDPGWRWRSQTQSTGH